MFARHSSPSRRLGLAVLALLVLTAMSAQAKDEDFGIKHRIIVGTFENKADHHWYHGPDPGSGMADMLITALVKSGKFKVFERAALDEVLAEKELSFSDLADPTIETERKLAVGDILVKGVITEFGYKEEKIGGSISKWTKKGSVGSYKARVAVDLRLISVGNAEVLWADTVAKGETSTSISVSTSEFSFGDQKSFDEHVVGKATRKVINSIVDKLEEQTKNLPWSGVLIVADEFLFIDGGTELGIKAGMRFEVKRMSKEVKHPKTGAVLKRLYETVGEVKATEVEEGITTVEAVSGGGFKNGDEVFIKK